MDDQWVSFHIRDHLDNGEISVRHTIIEGYVSHTPLRDSSGILLNANPGGLLVANSTTPTTGENPSPKKRSTRS